MNKIAIVAVVDTGRAYAKLLKIFLRKIMLTVVDGIPLVTVVTRATFALSFATGFLLKYWAFGRGENAELF